MAEFARNDVQVVVPNAPFLLNTVNGCNRGYILHRNGSGILTLRGIVNNPCGCFARYFVLAKSNVAIEEGGTLGPITVALTIDGEPLVSSEVIVTPGAVGDVNGITTFATFDVPRGCCWNVALESLTAGANITGENTVVVANRTA